MAAQERLALAASTSKRTAKGCPSEIGAAGCCVGFGPVDAWSAAVGLVC